MTQHSCTPTPQAALQTLHAVRPSDYARTRNHLGGAVTHLSPYLTHGLLQMPDVLSALALRREHKLVFELGWREFFHHAWRHDGDAIFTSLHEGPLPDAAYTRELPADIREGRTGVPAIDQAVRALYATGYVHNHARMWLASYIVHLRKVHWRAAPIGCTRTCSTVTWQATTCRGNGWPAPAATSRTCSMPTTCSVMPMQRGTARAR